MVQNSDFLRQNVKLFEQHEKISSICHIMQKIIDDTYDFTEKWCIMRKTRNFSHLKNIS